MKARVSELLQEIRQREEELEVALRSHEVKLFYRLDGTKVEFDRKVRQAHRRLKVGIFRWLRPSSFRNTITAPNLYR